ncbi:MAG: Gfo/Idh/MocA family oxidoreductase [Planctomycetes bacterium]|nr:Gfo/Idh/MocA family oxidoreductase [Planctomycetota bacterium]MBL7039620.1 Gfo/Idh/MocA family oxidoreductase [Pirellulaceae bacterium]
MSKTRKHVSRRSFLKTGAVSAAAFSIVPGHVVGADGQTPPSEKLNIAGIGVGGMGRGNIGACRKENIVALCDVDSAYAGRTFDAYPQAKRYTDYRVMLEKQKDIAGVVIATPDHTHAVITLAAMQLGKHVFCQKPLTHTVLEAHKIAEAARASKVQTQMGNQGHSSESIRMVREWIQSGSIGDVKQVHAWTDRPDKGPWYANFAARDLPQDFPPVPDTLDWDLWLGPAQDRKYSPAYHPFKWRAWLDFGTGALGDMGCHILDPACWGLDLVNPSSIIAEVKHHKPELKGKAYPIAATVTYEFPQRGKLCPLTLKWHDGVYQVPRPPMLEEGRNLPASGAVIYGEKETILHGSHGAGGARIIPEDRMKNFQQPEKTIPRVKDGHMGDWLRACKDGNPASSNFAEYAGQLTEMVLLGVAAQRVPAVKLNWNAERLEFDNEEANKHLHTPYRKGWSLG